VDSSKRFVLVAQIVLLTLLAVNAALAWLVPAIFATAAAGGY
jgi:hypothetical protein